MLDRQSKYDKAKEAADKARKALDDATNHLSSVTATLAAKERDLNNAKDELEEIRKLIREEGDGTSGNSKKLSIDEFFETHPKGEIWRAVKTESADLPETKPLKAKCESWYIHYCDDWLEKSKRAAEKSSASVAAPIVPPQGQMAKDMAQVEFFKTLEDPDTFAAAVAHVQAKAQTEGSENLREYLNQTLRSEPHSKDDKPDGDKDKSKDSRENPNNTQG